MIDWPRLLSRKMGAFPIAEEFIFCVDSVMLKRVRHLGVTFLSDRAAVRYPFVQFG